MDLAPPDAFCLRDLMGPSYQYAENVIGTDSVNTILPGPPCDTVCPPRLSFLTKKDIFARLIEACAFLQTLGLLHLDLKPDNVMVQLYSTGSVSNSTSTGLLGIFFLDYENFVSAEQYQYFPSVRFEAQLTDVYVAPERCWDRFDLERDHAEERELRKRIFSNFKKQYSQTGGPGMTSLNYEGCPPKIFLGDTVY